MSSRLPTIGVEHVQHPKRGQVRRLTFHGWLVDIDGTNVTVPEQHSAGKTVADLATLLGAAYKMINTPITRSADAEPRIRDVLPAPIVGELIHVLQAAQAIADERWHRSTFDIYQCTRLAWQNAGMMLPHTLLITTLRAALPPATTLADYNHAAVARTIHALFDDAINIWRRRLAPQSTGSLPRTSVA
jgi:hypothetical protein